VPLKGQISAAINRNGTLIEANPFFCEKIRANRPNCELVPKAVLDVGGGVLPFRHVGHFPELSSLEQFASSDKHRVSRENHEKVNVEVVEVGGLFRELGVSKDKLDFLSIDIEGPDVLVLSAIVSAGYRPKVVTIEHNFEVGKVAEIERIIAPDYNIVLRSFSNWDLWAIRKDIKFPESS
jgi:FkbM family methyltransferase